MSSIFSSDVFDWARDLAIIGRIFGPARPAAAAEPGSVVQFGDARSRAEARRGRGDPASPDPLGGSKGD